MERFCVFCGNEPELKNREHVIPQWLIRLTGDPNREVYLGRQWSSPTLDERRFSLSSFAFPACKKCNDEASSLEAKAKSVVEAALSRSALSATDWDTLLNWLDKVRTGLWLGMIYLNQNHRFLKPLFHIAGRTGAKDRFVIVYEVREDGQKGVGWTATESPLFQHMPSCFTLMINNLLFFNASHDFLLAPRFGFPFPARREFRSGGGEWIDLQDGTGRIRFPLLDKKFKTGGTQLFQPMIPRRHLLSEDGEQAHVEEHYDNDHVRALCMDFELGRGKVFRRDGNQLVEYSGLSSREWFPKQVFPRGELSHQVGVHAGELLEQLWMDHPSLDGLPADERAEREAEVDGALQLHRVMIKHFIKQRDIFY